MRAAIAVLASVVLAGCAHTRVSFEDVDGSRLSMTEVIVAGAREETIQAGSYRWSADGSGEWSVGADMRHTDLTEAIPLLERLVEMLGAVAAPTPTLRLRGRGLLDDYDELETLGAFGEETDYEARWDRVLELIQAARGEP